MFGVSLDGGVGKVLHALARRLTAEHGTERWGWLGRAPLVASRGARRGFSVLVSHGTQSPMKKHLSFGLRVTCMREKRRVTLSAP